MKYYYDIVWTDYQYENNLTTTQMQEKEHVDEMIKRVEQFVIELLAPVSLFLV